jgi:hypothetical protein
LEERSEKLAVDISVASTVIKTSYWEYLTNQQLMALLITIANVVISILLFIIVNLTVWIMVSPIANLGILFIGGYFLFKRIIKSNIADLSRQIYNLVDRYKELYLEPYDHSLQSLVKSILNDQNLNSKYGKTLYGWYFYFDLAKDIVLRESNSIIKKVEVVTKQEEAELFKAIIEEHFDTLIRHIERITSNFFEMCKIFTNEWSKNNKFKENYSIYCKKYNDLIGDVRKFTDELERKTDLHIYKDALRFIKEESYEFESYI